MEGQGHVYGFDCDGFFILLGFFFRKKWNHIRQLAETMSELQSVMLFRKLASFTHGSGRTIWECVPLTYITDWVPAYYWLYKGVMQSWTMSKLMLRNIIFSLCFYQCISRCCRVSESPLLIHSLRLGGTYMRVIDTMRRKYAARK